MRDNSPNSGRPAPADQGLLARYERALLLLAGAAQSDCRTARDLAARGQHRDALACLARACDYAPESSFAAEQAVALLNSADLHSPIAILDHGGAVWSVQFSPDGARIVTASYDNSARVWDARTGETIATLAGHGRGVSHAQFSPDGADRKSTRLNSSHRH